LITAQDQFPKLKDKAGQTLFSVLLLENWAVISLAFWKPDRIVYGQNWIITCGATGKKTEAQIAKNLSEPSFSQVVQ
jgi:hypothetical protein